MAALFMKVLQMSISTAWLVLIVVVFRWVLKKAPKWIHCTLWGLVAFRLLCPFSLESAMSLAPPAQPISQRIVSVQVYDAPANAPAAELPVYVYAGEPYTDAGAVNDGGMEPVEILAGIWLLGMTVMAVYAFTSYARIRRKVAPSVLSGENVYLCDYIDTPFILGVIRPKIYLPSTMTSDVAAFVLAHEKTHILRRDHWWKPLGFALLSVHWFNPAVWLAYTLLCRDIELACDEKVIQGMDMASKKAYSEALLNCSIPRHMIAACPLAFGEVGVKERVKSVLNYKKPAFWIILAAIVLCAVVAVCFLTDPVTEDEPAGNNAVFQATVQRVADNSILVARDGNGSDLIWVSAETGDIRVGDTVKIEFDGMIAESYPAQIHNTYQITVAERLLTDDVLAEIQNTLGAAQITFFDHQVLGDYDAVGCEYDGKCGIVYLRGGAVHRIVPQEELLSMNEESTVWRNRSMMQVTGKQVFLIKDPDVAGVYIPGDEDSWIYIYNYPALLAVDETYQLGLDGSLAGGYIPTQWRNIDHRDIHLKLPITWEYELYAVTDEDTYGIQIWPAGESQGRLDIKHTASWGVCGTGLMIIDSVLKPNGYPAAFGYYDGSDMWTYIHFGVQPGTYVALNYGAEDWWDEYGEEAMSILGNLTLSRTTVTEAEVMEIASQLRFNFDTIEVEFNPETGVWDVYYYNKNHEQTAYVTIDQYGDVN